MVSILDTNYKLHHFKDEYDGDIKLNDSGIETLGGFPKVVKGHVLISGSELKNLKGTLRKVTRELHVKNSKLTSLEGCPSCSYLALGGNKLKNLKGCSKAVDKLYVQDNPIESLEGCPKNLTKLRVRKNKHFKTDEDYLDEIIRLNIKVESLSIMKDSNGIGGVYDMNDIMKYKELKKLGSFKKFLNL